VKYAINFISAQYLSMGKIISYGINIYIYIIHMYMYIYIHIYIFDFHLLHLIVSRSLANYIVANDTHKLYI